jgi:hypothetical protein
VRSAAQSDNTLRGLGIALLHYLFNETVFNFGHYSAEFLDGYELKKEGI